MSTIEPISPEPLTSLDRDALPAYLGNGVVGMRVRQVPFESGLAMLSGFAGLHPVDRIETFARAPYPLAADVSINGIRLSAAPERVRLVQQRYDFSAGELHTELKYSDPDVGARIDVLTFCSRTMPTLVLQQTTVRPDAACDLSLQAGIDESEVDGQLVTRTSGSSDDGSSSDGSLCWESAGALGRMGAAYATRFTGGEASRSDAQTELATTYDLRAAGGQRYVLQQIASILPDAMHHEPEAQAVRMLAAGVRLGFDRLRSDNRSAWQELWLGRLQLIGADERWQALADASLFYLLTSVHPSSPSSTALFGLANWPNYHYYRGHIMWDLEFFALPPLTLLNPDGARTLLAYRFDRLPAARMNARMNGRPGLQFPWESSIRYGDETTPDDASGAALEQHVSADVALAFARFAQASGDHSFALELAWPVLSGVADWVVSRVERSKRGYEWGGVSGIAEREPAVDNNAFTNMTAIVALREAAALARLLGQKPRRVWEQVAAGLVVPLSADGSRIVSHDGYRSSETKGATPDPLAGLFPAGFETHPDVERATLEFYLSHAEGYVGAPMLSALLGTWAARSGDRKRSTELFERGYADYLLDPFTLIDEYAPAVFPDMPRAGPFTANIGAFLTGCLLGLTGLSLTWGDPVSWCKGPVRMPSAWEGVEVERIWAHGRPVRLLARQGDDRPTLEELDS